MDSLLVKLTAIQVSLELEKLIKQLLSHHALSQNKLFRQVKALAYIHYRKIAHQQTHETTLPHTIVRCICVQDKTLSKSGTCKIVESAKLSLRLANSSCCASPQSIFVGCPFLSKSVSESAILAKCRM